MGNIHWFADVSYVIIPLGSLVLVALLFTPSMRGASWWLRLGYVIQVPLAFAWSALSFYLARHVHVPDAASTAMWDLAQNKSFIAGISIGSLVALLLSPEMRQLSRKRRDTSNQTLQPTPSRPVSSRHHD